MKKQPEMFVCAFRRGKIIRLKHIQKKILRISWSTYHWSIGQEEQTGPGHQID